MDPRARGVSEETGAGCGGSVPSDDSGAGPSPGLGGGQWRARPAITIVPHADRTPGVPTINLSGLDVSLLRRCACVAPGGHGLPPATVYPRQPLRGLSGGSDGDRLREIDAVTAPHVPFPYPERRLGSRERRGAGALRAGCQAASHPGKRWPEAVALAKREGLRGIARDLGVSHETVRAVLLVADAAGQAR
jgi:hypothetical protein